MNICIISGFKEKPDEGMKIFASKISEELSKSNDVLHINAKENIFSFHFWLRLRKFNPQIIHLFLRLTPATMTLLMIFGYCCKNSKLVVSVLQPPEKMSILKVIFTFFKPDVILTQSSETEKKFIELDCKTGFLPSGVDTEKFRPVDEGIKKELRRKHGISESKFVVLHVGHINEGRNLEIFKDIRDLNGGIEVIIIGSTNEFNFNRQIYDDLLNAGIYAKREFYENIEEFYQLSDCYVFPTIDSSFAIEIPLSVLEAMGCNLPVISTKFGGLSRIIMNDNDIIFVDSTDDINNAIHQIRLRQSQIESRDVVLNYSWKNIAHNLDAIYQDISITKVV